jgi:hypothetical protein
VSIFHLPDQHSPAQHLLAHEQRHPPSASKAGVAAGLDAYGMGTQGRVGSGLDLTGPLA